ncbi:phage baseplate assembly protein V (plasmid) [Roseomonas marmotae]|uniref:phage baseplate assembly protein V n=1 Tax=Roseomonas marmotae TaxID=2768161 RepID=UPI001AD794C8|nr:phage baseplate assembly protein V [Roseomonas marmotae]QTI81495.1 phage baseplate assembly protein V [Roseomonas marmotae]
MSDYFNAENERLLAGAIRLGVVSALDEANARVRVKAAGYETDWLPWLTARAGATRSWSAPRPGEQVVLLCPYGDPAQGVVLPGIYQNDHPAPAASKDIEAVVFPDGTRCEYDSSANKLQIDVAGAAQVIVNCKQATLNTETAAINASTSATITTPEAKIAAAATEITGSLKVGNGLTVIGTCTNNGVDFGSTHVHGGVDRGTDLTDPPQ